VLCVAALLAPPAHAQRPRPDPGVLLHVTFDQLRAPFGPTPAQMAKIFLVDQRECRVIIDGTFNGFPHNAQDIVVSPDGDRRRGNVLRVFNSKGAYKHTDGSNPPSAGAYRPLTAHPRSENFGDEIFGSYERYVPVINPRTGKPYQQTKNMKQPLGFYGGSLRFEGVRKPDGTDGWSYRVIVLGPKAGARRWGVTDYLYDMNHFQSNRIHGGDKVAENPSLSPLVDVVPGKWWKITLYMKLNTPGKRDGKSRVWVGEVGKPQNLLIARERLEFQARGHRLPIKGMFSLYGYGGNNPSFAAPEDQDNYFDNFIVRTTKPPDIPAEDL